MLKFALLLPFVMTNTSFAQFDDIGFGGQQAEFSLSGNLTVESHGLVIAVAKSQTAVYGFSDLTGIWEKVDVPNQSKQKIIPIASDNVACFAVGNKVYAFSAVTGTWKSIEFDAEHIGSVGPVVGRGITGFQAGNKVYAFGSQHAKWSVVESSSPPVISVSNRLRFDDGSKVYTFSNNSKEWAMVDLGADE